MEVLLLFTGGCRITSNEKGDVFFYILTNDSVTSSDSWPGVAIADPHLTVDDIDTVMVMAHVKCTLLQCLEEKNETKQHAIARTW